MKRRFFGFLILLSFVPSASAQIKEARKIDEFENTNCDDYRGRTDFLLTALRNSSDAQGYIFVYEGDLKQFIYDRNGKHKGMKYVSPEMGAAQGLTDYLKNHIRFRKFPAEKITFVQGGFREKFTVELWIVPNKANPPKPTPTLKKIKRRKQKRKPSGFCGEI